MKPVFIYTLNDPITGIVRYAGQTVDPDVRLTRHIRNARKDKYHCARWVQSLLLKNLHPVMEILDVVPDTEADFWEREYIQNFRERGFDLTNCTDGGEGVTMTAEVRAKIGAKSKGRRHSEETRAKIRAARAEQIFTPETQAKKSAAMSGEKSCEWGKKHSLARREKSSSAHIGLKNSRNTSGFVGVSWDKSREKWVAQFNSFGKSFTFGRFKKIEDAVFARALGVAIQKGI